MPSQNTTYTASFAIDQHTLTVNSNNTNYGTVSGGGTYNYGASATLKATPKTGYHFVQWNDGNKNATRSVTVTGNATYTATFAVNQYTLTLKTATNNTTQGTVRFAGETAGASVSGTFNHGAGVNIIATPATGYHFVKWSDNNTNANRTVYVTAAATYTATFAINSYTLTVKTATNNTTQGTVKIGSGTAGASASASFNHGASATITATPATGYHFVKWDDGNTTASRSVSVTAAKTYIATFAINTYTLTVNSNNTSMGTVSGGGSYNHGASATLTATPKGCYRFKQWNDGNTSNPRTVSVTADATYTAQYEDLIYSGTCGADGDNLTWTLNACDSTLIISGTGAMANYPALNMPWKYFITSITSVIISDGVTTIGSSAFQGCSNLRSLTVPPSLTSVGQNAFSSCWAMESVYISDLTAWCNINFGTYDSSPFCRNGYAIHVGGGDLYVNGAKVTTLTIPDGITEIKNDAFYGFAGITDIQFNQVTTIGNSAFNGCHGLTSVTLPEGVTSIGQYGICYCSHLQSISIPASASSLGTSMVVANQALTDIYVHWTENVPAWPDNFTNKTPQSAITLHVPCSAIDEYQDADGWKDYTIEGEGGPYTVTVQTETGDTTQGTVSITINP